MSQLAIYSDCSFTAKDFYLIYSNKNQVADLWREKKKLRKELIFLTKMERIKLKAYLRIQFLRFGLQTKAIFKAHMTS